MPTPYSICYADPAWFYRDEQKHRPIHYGLMSLEKIKAMPVRSIMARDSVLFLWTTGPLQPEAHEVIKAWGFTFVTMGFVWIKRYRSGRPFMGMGSHTRANAEFCMLARRGNGLRRLSGGVEQVIESVPRRHSEKPHETRDRIVELYGDKPRIELFARHKVGGWDRWGNEAPAGPGRLALRALQ